MALYKQEQLVIVFGAALLLLGLVFAQLLAPAPHETKAPQQLYAYELAGGVPAPGIYRFEGPQSLARLLAAAQAPAELGGQPDRAVANGSRIIVAGKAVAIEPMRAQDRINCFLPIQLGTATAEDLQLVPGLGKKTARAIIEHRDRVGGITSLAELKGVGGIGAKKLERFKAYLTVEPE